MVVFAVTTGLPPAILWLWGDVTRAVPVFVNLITISFLAPKFFELLRDFNAREFGKSVKHSDNDTSGFWMKDIYERRIPLWT